MRVIVSLGVEAKVLKPEELRQRVQQAIPTIARHYAEK